MNTCVAIPVGGRVVPEYLIENVEQIKKSGALLYIGLDSEKSLLDNTDSYSKVREICYEYADKVIEFEPEYYYRPGGIWKKMYDCWKDSGAKYVRALGYDDILPSEFIIAHDKFMEQNNNIDASYSNLIIRDEFKKEDVFKYTKMSTLRRVLNVGRNPFSFMCWSVKFDAISSSEYEHMLLKSAYGYEYFFYGYLSALNIKHFDSPKSSTAIRREHLETISSQHEIQGIDEKNKIIQQIRDLTGYSMEATIADRDSLNMRDFYRNQRLKINYPIGKIVNLFREE